jgi:hypothetical protein
MTERVAPDAGLSPTDRAQLVDSLTVAQRRAIALTLEDLRGWGDPARSAATLRPPYRGAAP